MQLLLLLLITIAATNPTVVIAVVAGSLAISTALLLRAETSNGAQRSRIAPAVAIGVILALGFLGLKWQTLSLTAAGAVLCAAIIAAGVLNEFGYRRAVVATLVFGTGTIFGLLFLAARRYVDGLNIFI